MSERFDVAIVGGGPAGASAAVFCARAGLTTLVIDADKGITRRARLDNHLGLPDGITGPELVERGRRHAERFGATWVQGNVEAIEGGKGAFTLRSEGDGTYEASQVVLATGIAIGAAEAAGVELKDATEPRINKVAVVDAEGRTSVPGIWAAGTIGGVSVHTIVTAGDGARVAINLISEVKGERWVDHDILPAD